MSEKKRLLIVEDEAIPALLLKKELEAAGFEVAKPVASGEAAVAAVNSEHFDVILMDKQLAGAIDGIEAARQIRCQHDIPIIFVTGFNDEQTTTRIKSLAQTGLLTKPVTSGLIIDTINTFGQE